MKIDFTCPPSAFAFAFRLRLRWPPTLKDLRHLQARLQGGRIKGQGSTIGRSSCFHLAHINALWLCLKCFTFILL